MNNLPDEILLLILLNLSVNDLFRCLRVNKQWNEIVNDNSLWRKSIMDYAKEQSLSLDKTHWTLLASHNLRKVFAVSTMLANKNRLNLEKENALREFKSSNVASNSTCDQTQAPIASPVFFGDFLVNLAVSFFKKREKEKQVNQPFEDQIKRIDTALKLTDSTPSLEKILTPSKKWS